MSSQKQAILNTESERIVPNPYKKEAESNKISDSPNKDNHQQILINENVNKTDSPEKSQNNQTPIDYSNYTNIGQLNPISTKQLDNNTFLISEICCEKAKSIMLISLPFIIIFVFSLLALIYKEEAFLYVGILFIPAFIRSIIYIIVTIHYIYIILDPNNITVKEKGWCRKRTTIFHSGLLNRVELKCERKSKDNCCSKNEDEDYYILMFYSNSQNIFPDICFWKKLKKAHLILFTDDEMGYFNYVVNNHIQKNMMN